MLYVLVPLQILVPVMQQTHVMAMVNVLIDTNLAKLFVVRQLVPVMSQNTAVVLKVPALLTVSNLRALSAVASRTEVSAMPRTHVMAQASALTTSNLARSCAVKQIHQDVT